MPASVNLSCQNVPARQKHRVEGSECRGQEDRREEINGSGCLTESMSKGQPRQETVREECNGIQLK